MTAPARALRVLVVDDDPRVLAATTELLRSEGLEVSFRRDARDRQDPGWDGPPRPTSPSWTPDSPTPPPVSP